MATRADDATADAYGVVWAGDVTSKSGAGRYAIEHFPAWADLTERAIAWRDGRDETFVTTDGLAAAAMVEAIVDDALGLG